MDTLTDKYKLLVYAVHSGLESRRNELVVNDDTTVDNFRMDPTNNQVCLDIHQFCIDHFNYELSYNQVCNGVNLFLKAFRKGPKESLERLLPEDGK